MKYTLENMEDAAALWEAVLEFNHLEPARLALGTAEVRRRIVLLSPTASEAFYMVSFPDLFDWEFCPIFIAACVDEETAKLHQDWISRLLKRMEKYT